MSLRVEGSVVRKAVVILVLALVAALLVPAALGQSSDQPVPKVEIFAGYAWMNPGASVWDPPPASFFCGSLGCRLRSIPSGLGTSATITATDHWGLTLDFGAHWGPNSTIYTFMAGPQVKWRREHVSPFLHALVGYHHLNWAGLGSGIGLAAGGGLDLHVNRWLDFRLIEADYMWAHHSQALSTEFSGVRLRTGLLFKLGGERELPKSCSVSVVPMEVMAGEPVQVTASG
ncbi:MAG TPA: hypothetical protein VGQ94_06385, partial [Terriglobales bacterium]|nr:hypothetical protein [Terriglobales bacterium]